MSEGHAMCSKQAMQQCTHTHTCDLPADLRTCGWIITLLSVKPVLEPVLQPEPHVDE